jgi:hypothetical protein
MAVFNWGTNSITVAASSVAGGGQLNMLRAVLLVVHESVHAEQYNAGWLFSGGDPEYAAYQAERILIERWYASGMIDKLVRSALLQYVLASLNSSDKEFKPCVVCRHEYHQHESLASITYMSKSIPIYSGVWGLEVNPKGPLAPTRQ